MRHDLERSQENLTLSKSGTIVTIGVCELCNGQFKSYLPNPDQAMWEVKAWFYVHCCIKANIPQRTAA
jgi:hypothetical protein